MIESVQFPWRLLAVTAVLQVLCLSGIVPLFLRLRNEWMFPTFILVTFLASMLYYKEQFAFEPMMNRKASDIVEWYRADKLNQYAVFAATNEFLPIYCTALPAGKPRGTSPIIEANPSHVNVFQYPDSTSFKLHLLAVASQPVWLTVNQLFLSGWKILVNGRSVEGKTLIEDLPADGRIRLYLPEGKHEIVAWYEGPPGWRSRNIAIAVFSILFVFYLCYDTRIDEFTVYIAPVGKRESSNGEIAT
jgi:hypothetical protein